MASFGAQRKASGSHRFPTPKDTGTYISTLSELLRTEYDLTKVTAIVVASRGYIQRDIIVHDEIVLGWQNFKIVEELRHALQTSVPIFLENDTNLAGLAEINVLKPRPKVGLYITVSTGIGTGIITNGLIDESFRLSEGGKSILEFDGILRPWESFASGRAIYETYGKYAHDIHDAPTWEAIADKISRGLLALIPLLQPEVVVIGGSIGIYFPRYQKVLGAMLSDHFSQSVPIPRLHQAIHPEEAVVYGCYMYAKERLSQ